jgi:hypothetical protein
VKPRDTNKETDNERESDKYGKLILANNVSTNKKLTGVKHEVRVFSPPAVEAMQTASNLTRDSAER